MLKHLYIKNFALIDVLDIELENGFSVITGETGAGKSIILGALGLLLGQRADSKTVKQGADRCVVEARFDLSHYAMHAWFEQNDIDYEPEDTIVRRELSAQGKSRAFINDTPVQLGMLKELGEQLVDIHSQHQNLLLSKHDFQLSVVDTLAKSQSQRERYYQAYLAYRNEEEKLGKLKDEIAEARRNADFMQFQFDEINKLTLRDGEQEELEQRSDTMTHAEDIKSGLYQASELLSGGEEGGVINDLKRALSGLQTIADVYQEADSWIQRLNTSLIELKDIDGDLRRNLDHIDFDPHELETVNSRLDSIYALQRKYGVETVADLIGIAHKLKERLSLVVDSEAQLESLQRKVSELKEKAANEAQLLSEMRKKATSGIKRQMQSLLTSLGMPAVTFDIRIDQLPLSATGIDHVAFLFSANTSSQPQPISQVASGGEIARVMLSLKAMISGAVKMPTIIFDEIDTGVSGKIAQQMAEIMAEMGRNERQVISITHLPQIAARGTVHYKVYKEETAQGTQSHMRRLDTDERVIEIAQMLSGSDITHAAMQNAKDLLKLS